MASTSGHFGIKFSKEDFNFISIIGKGSLGEVWHAKVKKTDRDVAIKEMNKAAVIEANFNAQVINEVTIHSKLRHDNIINFLSYFEAKEYVYIVQEYASRGSLFRLAQNFKFCRLGDDLAAKYCYQVADALLFLHSEGYFHGDVKPENILIDDNGDAKLCDFGSSWKITQSIEDQVYCGTLEYIAPERIRREYYDCTIDHWGVGVLLYELLAGRSPFVAPKTDATTNKILNIKYKFTKFIPEDARDLIKKLLVIRERRIKLIQVIRHSFIRRCYNPRTS